MYGLLGLGSIEEELIFIAVLSVTLVILMFFECHGGWLENRRNDLYDFIYYIGMFIKYMYKRWREKQHK